MKTFKQLREATAKRDENPEAAALKPRAQGEQDFVDAHSVDSTDYPVKGTSAKLNADSSVKTKHQPGNGDRTRPEQGTSTLKDQSGFKGSKTKLTPADKTQGDMKPLRLAPSSVQAFKESIFVNAPVISEDNSDTITVELLNGDEIEINEDVFNAITDVFERLNTGNREIFRSAVNENIESFEKILDFVYETLSGEEE
jgi:hypothetical protein